MKAKSRASARAAGCVLAGLAVLAPCLIGRAQFSQRVAQLQEADAALYNLRTAERAIEIAQEAELVAGEDLRVVRERYSVGVATILDVLISPNAADQASVDVVTSRYDYVLARAELESILGRVL